MLKLVSGQWIDDMTSDVATVTFSTPSFRPSGGSPTVQALASADQKAAIAFISGIDANGLESANSFGTILSDVPPATYSSGGGAAKWGSTVAGTSGGTVSYFFDPGSNWTVAETQSFVGGLTLWSDEANISFTAAASAATAQVVIYRYGSSTYDASVFGAQQGGAYEVATNSGSVAVGSSATKTIDTAIVSIQTTGSFGDLASFSVNGGYGVGTVVHELGHLIGLGHAGPYNGNVNQMTQQLNEYDNYNWSIMSYIDPTEVAKYSSSYVVTGTNYAGLATSPTTPEIDDILAAQSLYGVATTGALTMAQTFGFNTTITDATRSYFDFSVNATPVVTIYDTAADNTLDLSGYNMACTVNLNQATFSSVGGLTNNLSIAYNTSVTRFVGGGGDDVIIVNGSSDIIDGSGGSNIVRFANALANWTLSAVGGVVTAVSGAITDTLRNIVSLQFADQTVLASDIACFAEGTLIRTERGEVAVEALRVGDRVVTRSGALRPIIWLGQRSLWPAAHPQPEQVMPVRIVAHAFAEGMPARDLMLSPEHAVFFDGVLIPVGALVNGVNVVPCAVERVVYWHVELDVHDVLLSEGLPTESYLDGDNRDAFEGGGSLALHPVFAASDAGHARPCVDIVRQGDKVEQLRIVLQWRAEHAMAA